MTVLARRIAILLHDFHRGGTERVAIALAALWAEAGREVIILCGSEGGGLRDTVDSRVAVRTLDPPIRRSPISRLRLGRAMGRELARLKPDIVFLPGNYHALLAPALRRANPDATILLKISNPPLPAGLAGWLARLPFRCIARAVDGFAAMNAGLALELEKLYPGKRTAVLYDPVVMTTEMAVPRKDGPPRVLWAGRLEPQKDVMLALRVIETLNTREPAHLTLLGDGTLANQTDQAIRRMGLERHVTRVGHVSDIGRCFAAADALLITSRYEGGPAVAVEALAQGVPVVSTDCSHLLREIITVPAAGRIVPSRDAGELASALEQVLRRPRPRPETLAALVVAFAPAVCARAYLDFFDSLMGSRHAG